MGGRLTPARFLKGVEGSAGLVTAVAKNMGCTRQALANWLRLNPEFLKYLDEERSKVLDVAENQLINQLTKGEPWAIKFFLMTQGKKRGYTERQEIEVTQPIRQQEIEVRADFEALQDLSPEQRKRVRKLLLGDVDDTSV